MVRMTIKCPYWEQLEDTKVGRCTLTGISRTLPISYCTNICKKCDNTSQQYVDYAESRMFDIPNKLEIPKQKKPSVVMMGIHFAKAMTKWIRAGVPVVSKEEYIERRQVCAKCHDGRACPVCGCQLWAKVALETEKCPKGKW